LAVEILLVVVEAPLRDVAVHVVKAPWVRLLLADLVGDLLGVALEPGVIAQRRRVGAEGVRRRRPGPARPLPLGLGRQAVDLAGLLRQPAAVLHGGVVGDADDREPFAAHAEGLVGVGRRRPGDGVGALFLVLLGLLLGVLHLPVQVVL